ncbi:MAG: hypothetical protein Q7U78_05935 [Gallionella sp.]|nr:hypothetical protein [Gallionella sp.]
MAENWSDFLQGAAQSVVDTGLKVYAAKNVPKTIDPWTGQEFIDGQAADTQAQAGGVSMRTLLIGGALLAVVFLVAVK